MKRWKDGDEIAMLDVMIEAIGKTAWLEPEEQNAMIAWIKRQKRARQLVFGNTKNEF